MVLVYVIRMVNLYVNAAEKQNITFYKATFLTYLAVFYQLMYFKLISLSTNKTFSIIISTNAVAKYFFRLR